MMQYVEVYMHCVCHDCRLMHVVYFDFFLCPAEHHGHSECTVIENKSTSF